MVKIKQDKKLLTPDQKKEVELLNQKLEELYDRLADDPGNEQLNSRVREMELRIVRITGEKTIDY
ncbi:hypothetical protein [Parabacteroides gordonii]|uniref:hypothetical protein n=1 Tax=Parabacteroides gordonii TaxID=574930 RepID=UPI000EE8D168|nr:hypothetical protein [Parabacteroides gordonii]RGP09296.1 hypothetical protein DXB27_23775 [Parabacteroides gordonii]